jgi:DNA polymerase-3 subunit alpha
VAVKNVGEAAIDAILEARGNTPFSSLFEFCERVDSKKVTKRVLESLIKCGAFDSVKACRSQMMTVLEEALDYGQRFQKEKNSSQAGLFGMGEATRPMNRPTLPPMPEWDNKQMLSLEKEILGFYITGHPLDRYEALIKRICTANSQTLKEKNDKERVRIGGMVAGVKTIRTKRGDIMAFVTTEDMHGTIETTVFSEIYNAAEAILKEDSAILIEGEIQKDENSVKLLAKAIHPLEKAEGMFKISVHVNLDMSRTDHQVFSNLKRIFENHAGSCPAYLHLKDNGSVETVIALPETIRLNADNALTRDVADLLGYSAVETACFAADGRRG